MIANSRVLYNRTVTYNRRSLSLICRISVFFWNWALACTPTSTGHSRFFRGIRLHAPMRDEYDRLLVVESTLRGCQGREQKAEASPIHVCLVHRCASLSNIIYGENLKVSVLARLV